MEGKRSQKSLPLGVCIRNGPYHKFNFYCFLVWVLLVFRPFRIGHLSKHASLIVRLIGWITYHCHNHTYQPQNITPNSDLSPSYVIQLTTLVPENPLQSTAPSKRIHVGTILSITFTCLELSKNHLTPTLSVIGHRLGSSQLPHFFDSLSVYFPGDSFGCLHGSTVKTPRERKH